MNLILHLNLRPTMECCERPAESLRPCWERVGVCREFGDPKFNSEMLKMLKDILK